MEDVFYTNNTFFKKYSANPTKKAFILQKKSFYDFFLTIIKNKKVNGKHPMKKKKVSFNIEEDLLEEIKNYCDGRGFNISDFFRNASNEKMNRDRSSMVIFVPIAGKIEKFDIDTNQYIVDLWDASEAMSENVGAVCEGTITLNPNAVLPFYEETQSQKEIRKLLQPSEYNEEGKLAFYTKEKYTIKKIDEGVPKF